MVLNINDRAFTQTHTHTHTYIYYIYVYIFIYIYCMVQCVTLGFMHSALHFNIKYIQGPLNKFPDFFSYRHFY